MTRGQRLCLAAWVGGELIGSLFREDDPDYIAAMYERKTTLPMALWPAPTWERYAYCAHAWCASDADP